MNVADAGLLPLAFGDEWWAVFRRGQRSIDVREGRFGDGPARLLGLRRDGVAWLCETGETREVVERVFASGEPFGMARTLEDPRCGPRPVEFAFAPLPGDPEIPGVVVRCQELTARRAHHAALQLHAQVLDALEEGVLLLERDGTIGLANPAGERLLGYPPGGLAGQNLTALGAALAARLGGPAAADDGARAAVAVTGRDGDPRQLRVGLRAMAGGDGRRLAVLQDISDERRHERELLEAERRERERLARDLHDGVGQELTGIALLLRGVASSLRATEPAASTEIDQVIALVNGVIGSTRSMARGLFEPALPPAGLVGALEMLASRAAGEAGPAVQFTPVLQAPLWIDPRTAVELYRIAQEATTNALRHGRARRIAIRLEAGDARVSLTVDDDGCGLPTDAATREGMGLSIMRYRAHAIGSELELISRPGHGTRVTCVVSCHGRP